MDSFIPNKEILRDLITNAYVLDLETTLNSTSNFSGSPHDPANRIVAAAGMFSGFNRLYAGITLKGKPTPWPLKKQHRVYGHLAYEAGMLDGLDAVADWLEGLHNLCHAPILLVGHNIAFDLQYTIPRVGMRFPWHNVLIWDTMLAEFYLTGQEATMTSLEKACGNHSIPFVKDTEVTEQFQMGIGSDKINPTTLLEYLTLDVQSTNRLFMAQHQAIHKNAGVLGLRYLVGGVPAGAATAWAEC